MKLGLILAAAVAAQCAVGLAQTTSNNAPAAEVPNASTAPAEEVMPLIVIDDAPLPDAIRNLARQANMNIQFDPQVLQGGVGPDGKTPLPLPTVSFRWENITARQALFAVLDNHNLQLVEDPSTKISRVTRKDPAALPPLIPRVISLKYSTPTNVVPAVKATFSDARSQVIADQRTSQLIVVATEREITRIEELLVRLDTPPSQILIEARFIETSKNPRSDKGINWESTARDHEVSFGNVVPGGAPEGTVSLATNPRMYLSTATGFGPVGLLNSEGLAATVSFFNEDNQSEVLATPRAVALEGTPTELSFVRNIPVFEEEQGANTGGSVAPSTAKANYEIKVNDTVLNEVGTKLIVTPRVWAESNVFLDLRPELSEEGPLRAFKPGQANTPTAPIFIRRKINTQALVPSGMTLVLGGLREEGSDKRVTKVPLLGDIPGIGRAFRSDSKDRRKRELLIFVTPTILNSEDYVGAPEARDFLKQKPVDRPEPVMTTWDSAEPRDWTKPE